MKRLTICLVALALGIVNSAARADYSVENRGSWPADWPQELEPLRKQALTLVGPLVPNLHYAIPFSTREEFEAAWPHLLKVRTPGAPIVLRRGPSFWLGKEAAAGVVVHAPPDGQAPPADAKSVGNRMEKTIYVELIVDGQIVDLNRIQLPPTRQSSTSGLGRKERSERGGASMGGPWRRGAWPVCNRTLASSKLEASGRSSELLNAVRG